MRGNRREAFLALSTLVILVATLRSGGTTVASGWSFTLASGDAALAELIQNLLLFIPLGAALVWNRVRPLHAIAIGAALSFIVEFTQQWLPGRDPSVGDVIVNTVSTAIGVALVHTAPRWLTVPPRRAARQALATALAAALAWLGTGALLRPTPGQPPYSVVTAPNWNYWGHYQGQVLSAIPLPEGVRTVAVAPSRPPGRPAPLVALMDQRDRPVTLVVLIRQDLGLRYLLRARALTLEQPDMRWPDALAAIAPGDTFTVTASRGCLSVNGTGRCGLGYTIGDGWKLIFYPDHFPAWALTLLNALWVGGCVVGVGYWGGRAAEGGEGRRRAAIGGAAVGVAVLGMILVPVMTGLNATPVVEWVGGVMGIGAGSRLSINRVLKDRLGYYTRP